MRQDSESRREEGFPLDEMFSDDLRERRRRRLTTIDREMGRGIFRFGITDRQVACKGQAVHCACRHGGWWYLTGRGGRNSHFMAKRRQ